MKRYKVLAGGGFWGVSDGDTVELDLTAEEEAEQVDHARRLEIAPRTYKVIGLLEVHGVTRGKTFEAALPITQEAALLAGGHIELVTTKKTKGGNS